MVYVVPFGAAARRSGSAKFVEPLPPYRVPSSENSAEFWLMLRSRPSAGSPTPRTPADRITCPRVHVCPFEAMAMGRPIVISDLPALREIAEPEERGLVFPPDDAVALADAVQRLFEDPELAARLGEVGREWVVNERQWSMNGPRYVEAFAAAKQQATASTVEP